VRREIAVAARQPERVRRLLSVLADWLGVNIILKDFGIDSRDTAQLVFCEASDAAQFATPQPLDRLILVRAEGGANADTELIFSNSPRLPRLLRGQTVESCAAAALPATIRGEVLARSGQSAVWTAVEHGACCTEFSTESLRQRQTDQRVIDQLSLSQWTGLLPLIVFLRRMSGDDWVSPPLRACFMLDDPNLHWPTYGFLDYAALVGSAKKHNYHVAIATIPLDGWFVHSAVGQLFRENTAHLSLLMHGNNHTKDELARSYDDGSRAKLVAQSLKRIAHLQRISNLRVPRIMVPPHNACSGAVAGELLRQGFEAACISHEFVRRFNSTTESSGSFGLEPAQFLSRGLPVLPRFRLSESGAGAPILAALVGQPIIPSGHHQDLADDLRLLEKTTETINRLGDVKWCNLTEIARTNYKHRVSGRILQLKMYSRRIRVEVPPEIERVKVYRAWGNGGRSDELLERCLDGESWLRVDASEILVPRQNDATRRLELRWVSPGLVDYHDVPDSSLHPWAVVRRLLTETRDRCRLYRE